MTGGLSVVMPNYNHAHLIARALEAILGQSRPPLEVVVIDDASTDNSVEVLDTIALGAPSVRVVRGERNAGPVALVNRMLPDVRGRYVHFAAADDVILPGFYEAMAGVLDQYPTAGFASARSRFVEGGTIRAVSPIISPDPIFIPPEEFLPVRLAHGNWFMGNTSVFRLEALRTAGGFPAELRSFSDGFVSHLLAFRHGVAFVPAILGEWHRASSGYAGRTANDLDVSLDVLRRATDLMCGEYKDLFPPAFVERWQREWIADLLDAGAMRWPRGAESLGRACPSPSGVDRLLFSLLGTWGIRRPANWAFQYLNAAPERRAAFWRGMNPFAGGEKT